MFKLSTEKLLLTNIYLCIASYVKVFKNQICNESPKEQPIHTAFECAFRNGSIFFSACIQYGLCHYRRRLMRAKMKVPRKKVRIHAIA